MRAVGQHDSGRSLRPLSEETLKFHNDAAGEQLAERYHKSIAYANIAAVVLHFGLAAASIAAAWWHFSGAREHRRNRIEIETRELEAMLERLKEERPKQSTAEFIRDPMVMQEQGNA